MSSNSTQDVLSANEQVVDELDDGSRLVEIDAGEQWRVSTPYDDDAILDDERRAKLWFGLYAVVDAFERPTSVAPAIPLPVVLEGKEAVAVYLYAVRGWESEAVADRLDVERRTVWDYLSRVRKAAEDLGVEP